MRLNLKLRRAAAASLQGVTGALMLCILANGSWAQSAAAPDCGPLRSAGQYGPFDYRKDQAKIQIVLDHHFTPQVEMLIRGNESSIAGDIDYTLRAIPNNHRALIAMMRLAEREKTQKPHGANYSVECYFERAIRYQPDDGVVRMIYTTFLTKAGRKADALLQLDAVRELAGDNPFTHYNVGQLYFDLKEYDKALIQAHRAYGLGFQQPALREKLQTLGRWVAARADGADGSTSAASAPALAAASAPEQK